MPRKSPHRAKRGDRRSAEPPYDVGYGKPPRHTQFRLSESGNPKGRPKGARNLAMIVEDILNERVVVREGTRSRSISKRKALVLTLVNDALRSKPRAVVALLALLRGLGQLGPESAVQAEETLSAQEHALLARLLGQRGIPLADTAGAQPTDHSHATAKPKDRR
jgi:Family of unknown function (DUF5681)